jgi:hypothetical protein
MTTAENAPSIRRIASQTASSSVPGCSHTSAAITSVSDVVSSRTPAAARSARSSSVFVRLPLWPRATVRPRRWRTIGWAFGQRSEPVVE